MPNPAVDALTAVLPYIDSWLQSRAGNTRTPGVQAAVYFDGALQFSKAYGFADVENGVALTSDHLFRIASHSKTFTATAILQLFEAGELRLDDPAGNFVPALVEAGSPVAEVTVRELLEHSAGVIRDGLDGDYWQHVRAFPDQAELIAMIIEGGDKALPGEGFNYTNVGYSLLGLIVAAASGRSYNDYVTAEIVDRLGLKNTGPELDALRADEYARGYTGFHTTLDRRPVDHVDTRAMAAATGFYGTAEDLVHYFAAHFPGDERLVKDSSKRMQQREQWLSDTATPGAAHYGLGMIIERIGDHRVVGHSGGYPGHITRSLFDPAAGLAISVLTNAVDGPAAELSNGVLRLIDAALVQTPALSLAAPATARTDIPSARFTGRFANMWGVLDVVQLGERLVSLHPGSPNPLDGLDELEIVDENTLLIRKGSGFGSVGERMIYEFDAGGAVVSVRGSGGMSLWPLGAMGEVHPLT
ncbi:serine hydrolase domain-containing protein [Conyzicola sp.]|uniref:serine hydrolase domain-containing protein n=1 Tax=Conyzicola sp. TaxID=1969404 RepID=UPI00398A3A93